MERIAYFQPIQGASGDMILGALVDAGLPVEDLRAGLEFLGLAGWRIETSRERRGAIEATRLRVIVEGEGPLAGGSPQAPLETGHRHGHHHAHPHPHPHPDPHASDHLQPPTPPPPGAPEARGTHGAHRRLSDILALIDQSRLPARVKAMAAATFRRLGAAEAKVHGIPLEAVHFHEVGAIDSIVDIVGAAVALDALGVARVHSAPAVVGTGFVSCAHGTLPLPAPATLELLRGFPLEHRESGAELTTPTGAAILTTHARSFGTMPPMTVRAIGYGAGDARPGPIPNVLRVVLGEASAPPPGTERILLLETTVDDMSPQWLAHLVDRLFEEGALDVTVAPVTMKKSRSGHELKVLAPIDKEDRLRRTVFAEGTTLGLRRQEIDRWVLARESVVVETPWGPTRVKLGLMDGAIATASPEFEDLKTLSARSGLPLKEVSRLVMERYQKSRSAE